jgi:hypothetical protein
VGNTVADLMDEKLPNDAAALRRGSRIRMSVHRQPLRAPATNSTGFEDTTTPPMVHSARRRYTAPVSS